MAINFPDSPSNGDTQTINGSVYIYNSTTGKWDIDGDNTTNVSVSDTAPSGAVAGDQWFNSTDGSLYVYYNDGSSSQWVGISGPAGAAGAAGSSVTAYANTAAFPSSGNTVGDFAFASDTKALYNWDGAEWDRISSGPQIGPRYTTTPASTLALNNDGSTSTLTAVAVDESGFPITYDWDAYSGSTVYSASSLPPQLTAVSESSGVFTLTASTSNSDAGTVTFRTKASDGVLFTPAITTLTLIFGTNITTPSGYPFASSAGTNTFDLQGIHNTQTANAGFSSTLRTGKIYIELVMGSNTSDRGMIGLCPNEITSAGWDTANTFSLYSVFGSKYPGGVDIGLEPFNDTGDIVMFAYDTSTREVWAGVNGTWHQDPSTTSSSYTIGTSSTTAFKLMFGASNNSQNYNGTIITGDGTLNYTLPTGFEAH